MGFQDHITRMGLLPVPTQEVEVKSMENSRASSLMARARLNASGRVGDRGLFLPENFENFLGVYSNSVWVYSAVWIIATNFSRRTTRLALCVRRT